jgi:amidase/aspartyl-tRNA(Asn)/glutamyl-tRNA(Gln) amidotransferase subunit A
MTTPVPSADDELAYVDTTELAGRIARRELSPVEVMDATLARIEARNPSITAFVHEAFDEARASAREAERRGAAGEPVGPLHGVPTAMKDLFDFKPGWPATLGGIPSLREYTVPAHCMWAERMEAAGAIIVGKTNSPALGLRGVTDNLLFGPTRNPFDTDRNSGGSSGGGAAAVADGLVTIAEGTDAGGSIRIPAAWCGVYGYKQSWGRVPFVVRPDGFAGAMPFLFEGLLTRSVADAALGMTALAGPDPRDPFSARDEVDFLAATGRDIAGMRVAYSPNLDVFPVERDVAEAVARAAAVLEDAGAHVEEVTLGLHRDQRELSDLWCRLVMPITASAVLGLRAQGIDLRGERRDDLPPEVHHWLDVADGMTALDVARDQAMRTEVFDAVQRVFAGHDLLICPTVACLPVRNASDRNTVGPSRVDGVDVDPLIGWCLTYIANFTGHPAASVPAGLVDGMPVGMQIMGRLGADADVLAASAAFERLAPWRDTYAIPEGRAL